MTCLLGGLYVFGRLAKLLVLLHKPHIRYSGIMHNRNPAKFINPHMHNRTPLHGTNPVVRPRAIQCTCISLREPFISSVYTQQAGNPAQRATMADNFDFNFSSSAPAPELHAPPPRASRPATFSSNQVGRPGYKLSTPSTRPTFVNTGLSVSSAVSDSGKTAAVLVKNGGKSYFSKEAMDARRAAGT